MKTKAEHCLLKITKIGIPTPYKSQEFFVPNAARQEYLILCPTLDKSLVLDSLSLLALLVVEKKIALI